MWLQTLGCLALGEWLHHCGYLGHEDLFCIVLCILATFKKTSSASARSIPFLSFIVPLLCMKYSFGISNFLEEISSLSHSVVFLDFFALIPEEGFLISPCCTLELYSDAYIFPFLLCFLLLFFSQLFIRPSQTAILLFCISFSWGWSWSLSPVQCCEPPSIVHQALYLSDLVL